MIWSVILGLTWSDFVQCEKVGRKIANMKIFALDEYLPRLLQAEAEVDLRTQIYLAGEKESTLILEHLGMSPESELNLSEISFNKVEAEQEYFSGALAIPQFTDLLGTRHHILFFVNGRCIVFVNEDGYMKEMLKRLRRKHIRQGENREKFLSLFFSEIIAPDAMLLDEYERELMRMEEEVLHREPDDFHIHMLHVRKKLLILRAYYEQIAEIGKVLEENENGIFLKKQLKYFGTFSDRAERLYQRTIHLIDYANQVKDVYQAQVDGRQNQNMQYLTVISTIFFPLTLITGWYGMNFDHMPELEHGYPAIIVVSILVVIGCILLFKKKKIL